MKNQNINTLVEQDEIINMMNEARKKIAPLWPLDSFVAVNPYLGLSDMPFDKAADRLDKAAKVKMTFPVSFYLQAIENGEITEADLEYALDKYDYIAISAKQFLEELDENKGSSDGENQVPLIVDLATRLTGKSWSDFLTDRITTWASAYFDEGLALWDTSHRQLDIFRSWRIEAIIDKSPKIMGLKNFNKLIEKLPDDPEMAAFECLKKLNIPAKSLDLYFHSLLLRVGGWSAYVAKLDWDNKLCGQPEKCMISFLSILICWEACLLESLQSPQMESIMQNAREKMKSLATQKEINSGLQQNLILQEAYDHASQRMLVDKFLQHENYPLQKRAPNVQAVFCIDVRSEVFRRNLEMINPDVETMGFAGFFAFPVEYFPVGHEKGRAQCPVLIPPGQTVMESFTDLSLHKNVVRKINVGHQVMQAWKSFKLGAISCFSFVGPVGLSYLPKLFTDAFGFTRPVKHPDHKGIKSGLRKKKTISLDVKELNGQQMGITLEDQVSLAKSALKAMSLTDGFARLVLIVGHGSTTVNNPHATGLDCGACGGQSGEANARTAALVLNNSNVRELLKSDGIEIPDETCFVACLHDTTTDEVELFNEDMIPASHLRDVSDIKKWLAEAGHASRVERAVRLQINGSKKIDDQVMARSKDWSQVRPEWGLAGCNAFVVAPRHRTQGIDLGGKSFLHSYEWKKDEGFGVLELIMTAPMVVTSWINLQYYASSVDNDKFGSGNKTLHNITGGIGVLEGNTGDLRVGLPWQSVHDGTAYQHLPQRLNVVIEAPLEAMNDVLKKHESVRNLCDNGWIHLMSMNDDGEIAYRYKENLEWEPLVKECEEVCAN